MEVDIEIVFERLPKSVASSIVDRFDVEFSKENAVDFIDVVVRLESGNREGAVDQITNEFLSDLSLIAGTIRNHQGTLRLGIFYSVEESVVFPFRLSRETVSMLSNLNLSIDATGYPCSSDD